LPAVTILKTSDEIKEFSGKENVVIIGFFDSESKDSDSFKEVAEKLRENYSFGAVIGDNAATLAKENGADAAPAVVLFKKFDEGKNILAAGDLATLESFVGANSMPLIDEIGPQNYRKYMEASLPLAYLFVDLTVDGQKDTYVERVRELAKATKGKLNWVFINWAKYSRQAERLGLSGQTVPSLAIEEPSTGLHYVFDEKAEITAEGVKSWVDQFVGKTLAPTIKSEEIPESNDGPVKVVVAKNFDDIVMSAEKDVLLEFYAPWCGHCKKLAPIYEEIGEAFKSTPSIVVAKIDATANDVDPKLGVRGYPTLKFFPANNKTPIDYNGDRSKDDLIAFIKQHASLPVAADVGTDKDEL
jgi:protein disulfide-isomerase A1